MAEADRDQAHHARQEAEQQLAAARIDETAARQTAAIARLRAETTEQLLVAAQETVAAHQARADQALAHLDAARAEARDAIDRAARADTTRQTAETIRDDALAKLASLNEQSSRAAAETPPARPAR